MENVAPTESLERHHLVRIHIDRTEYHSPNPTTGAALYVLGSVEPGKTLFEEVGGDREDRIIDNTGSETHIHTDEHFYSGELEFKIIVNARERIVHTERVTFDEMVLLAFNPRPTGPNIVFTITYDRGPHANPEGTLPENRTVKVKNGMVFDVIQTDKS